MKTLRAALIALVVATGALAVAPAAHAGYWAATVLDPLPERIQAHRTYTFGYWVMQHASHPYDGDYGKLGRTALRIVDEAGASHTFDGVPLGQRSHYAAAVTVPHPGTWELYAVQGLFEDYKIGTLTVPGELDTRPLPSPVCSQQQASDWGIVRPPDLNRCEGGAASGAASSGAASGGAASGGSPSGDSAPGRTTSGGSTSGGSTSHGSPVADSGAGLAADALWALLALPVVAGAAVLTRNRPALAGWWRRGKGAQEGS